MNNYLFIVFDTARIEIVHKEKFTCRTQTWADAKWADLKVDWNATGEDRYLVYMLQI